MSAPDKNRPDAHEMAVVSSFLEAGYRIVCSCGWRTVLTAHSEAVALEQARQHQHEAAQESAEA